MAKARAQRVGECGYCGELKPLTQEHVPPKSFYGDVKPPNLPTIRACNDCNNGSSDDDEYFRDTMVKYHLVSDKPAAAGMRARFMRSVQKPEKRNYHIEQFKLFQKVDVRLPSGLILPRQPRFTVDQSKLRATASRYVRGLHRYEYKRQ